MTPRIRVSGFSKPPADRGRPDAVRVPFVRFRNTLWAWALLAGAAVFMIDGTPHLRVVYTYWGSRNAPLYNTCTYWGLHPQTVRADGDGCPLIRLLKGPPARRQRSVEP